MCVRLYHVLNFGYDFLELIIKNQDPPIFKEKTHCSRPSPWKSNLDPHEQLSWSTLFYTHCFASSLITKFVLAVACELKHNSIQYRTIDQKASIQTHM